MDKKQFWSRFAIYIILCLVIPVGFLIWRFELFQKVSKISIGGWGLVAIIFIGIFFIKFIKSVKNGLPFSILTQCLEGICKIIIPLLIAAFCIYYLRDVMDQVFQFLCVLIICEIGAIPANPIPQWAHENKKNECNDNIKGLLESLGLISKNEENK